MLSMQTLAHDRYLGLRIVLHVAATIWLFTELYVLLRSIALAYPTFSWMSADLGV